MNPIDLFDQEDICIKVYDPEKKEVIATYNSYKEASSKLGLTYKVIKGAAKTKTRRFCQRFNKEIAIRIAAKKKEEI
jgi:hypothetical protein